MPGKKDDRVVVASQWQLIRWKFIRHRMAVVGLIVLVLYYLAAIFSEFISPYDPYEYDEAFAYAPPQVVRFRDDQGKFHLRPFVYPIKKELDKVTWEVLYVEDRTHRLELRLFVKSWEYDFLGFIKSDLHLFGVGKGMLSIMGKDTMGRDLFSRIIFGSRISMTVGLLGIAISFFLGCFIGGISGLKGGVTDTIIQRIIESIRSIPTLPLWMALSLVMPDNWSILKTYFAIVMILSIVGWTGIARVVRGKFMALKSEDFIMAARLDGSGNGRLIFRYMLPSFSSHIIASLTLSIPGMILGETALSFIGLGLQPPAISWGVLLKDAQYVRVLAQSPWMLFPALFIVVSILAFNFVGDGLRDAADPYAKV